jgi:hypothetical protein
MENNEVDMCYEASSSLSDTDRQINRGELEMGQRQGIK